MLVLSRKPGEKIQIGDDVTVHVLKLPGGRVQLGVDAPRTTRVLRSELTVFDGDHDQETTAGGNQTDTAQPSAA